MDGSLQQPLHTTSADESHGARLQLFLPQELNPGPPEVFTSSSSLFYLNENV
jgi:hypothetical protein